MQDPRICPPEAVSTVALSLSKFSDGYCLTAVHWHERCSQHCGEDDHYSRLTFTEAMDIALTLFDEYRPGSVSPPWRQDRLFETHLID